MIKKDNYCNTIPRSWLSCPESHYSSGKANTGRLAKQLLICLTMMLLMVSSAFGQLYWSEPFNYPVNQAFDTQNGWTFQNPGAGYIAASSTPLVYSGIKSSPTYFTGGGAWTSVGVGLPLNSGTVLYNAYNADGQSGIMGYKAGGSNVFWFSMIARVDKDAGFDIYFHDNKIAWLPSDKLCISRNSGKWAIKTSGTYYSSGVTATVGTVYFLVAKVTFESDKTDISLFVNPDLSIEPTNALVSGSTTASLNICSIGAYLSSNSSTISIDELRLGASFKDVTPTDVITPVTGISVTPATITINKGNSSKLAASVIPSNATNDTITWSSDNAGVASVNASGLVTALGAGQANIIVTSKDGSFKDTTIVTVKNPVTGVSLITALSVNKGFTAQLTANIIPSDAEIKTLTWDSDNKNVATVSNTGLVTGIETGTANIIVTTTDGSFKDTTLITVTDPSLNLAPTIDVVKNIRISINAGPQTVNLTGISNGDANKPTQKVTVTAVSDNTAVIPNPDVTYTDPNTSGTLSFTPTGIAGVANITVTLTDDGASGGANVNTKSISFAVTVTEATKFGLTENFSDNSLAGWNQGSYKLSVANQEMKVIPFKSDLWAAFDYTFSALDLRNNPYVSLKIKSNFDFNIAIAVGNTGIKIDGYPQHIQMVDGMSSQEIVATDEYQEYSFDFTGIDASYRLDTINNLHFVVDPLYENLGSSSNMLFYIDDVKIGDNASHSPAVTAVPDQVYTVKATGTELRTVKLKNVTDGNTNTNAIAMTVSSSNADLLPSPQVVNPNNNKVGDILIQPSDNKIGESTVTVKLSAINTNADKLMTFKVKVLPNNAPKMLPLKDMLVKKGSNVTISLDEIDDGNPESEQPVTITAKSSDNTLANNFIVSHNPIDFAGKESFDISPSAVPGSIATITLKLKDDGGILYGGVDTSTYSFNLSIFDEVNHAPTIDSIFPLAIKAIAGTYTKPLTGITDGDQGNQTLQFEATASNDSIVTNLSIGTLSNGTALFSYYLNGKTGTDTISIKITDNGGNAGNNGNVSCTKKFVITSYVPPVYGVVLDYTQFVSNVAGSGLGNGQSSPVTEIATDGTVHYGGTVKSATWPSVYFNLLSFTNGKYVDMAGNKRVSFKFKGSSANYNNTAKAPNTTTQIVFRLVDTDNPGSATSGYGISAITLNIPNDDQWHDEYLDYSNLFYKDKDGHQTDSTRITKLMLDVNCTWFQEIKGDYYFKDIKVGDQADLPSINPKVSLNPIPDLYLTKGESTKTFGITGISDGMGNQTATLTASSSNENLITNITIGSVVNGTAQLRLDFNNTLADSTVVTVIGKNPTVVNSIPDTVTFKVHVIDTTNIGSSAVTIDFSKNDQTLKGFGCMLSSDYDPNLVANVLKANITLVRFTTNGEFEPVNDNSDPNVISWSGFNKNALPIDNIRLLNENTNCHNFFFTPWSAPAWMKQNKSLFPPMTSKDWVNNNKLMPEMYEEYAEYLVAVCKVIKEEAGVELYAISLQNEPTFNEPYPSCQYNGDQFKEIVKILGPRLKAEGLNTRIMMPEDISTQMNWITDKVNPTNNDPIARDYIGVIGIHCYDPSGITPDKTGPDNWTAIRNFTETTKAEGMWQTETSGYNENWEGNWIIDYMNGTKIFSPGPLSFAGVMFNGFKYGHMAAWTDYDNIGAKAKDDLLASVFNNYSRFLGPGSVMYDATSSNADLLSLAFKNADNTISVILLNRSNVAAKVSLKGTDVPLIYRPFVTQNLQPLSEGKLVTNGTILLPPRSIATLYHTSSNMAPTIDPIDNVTVELSKGSLDVNLTGIDDGDLNLDQNVSITAVTENASIATAVANYSAGSIGKLTITPVNYGTTKVTLKLKDDGGTVNGGIDSSSVSFYVKVIDAVNNAPAIDQVSDVTILEDAAEQTVNLTGISDGDNNNQNLTFTVTSSNPDLIDNGAVSYTTGSSTGTLKFKPLANHNGTTTLSVKVLDNGGTDYNNGNMSTEMLFKVNVTPVNDAPSGHVWPVKFYLTQSVEDSISVTNISNGDSGTNQTVNVMVLNLNPENLTDFRVDPTVNDKAVIHFKTTQASGKSSFYVILKDDGSTENGGIDSVRYSVQISVTGTNSIDEMNSDVASLYPNPVSTKLTVILGNSNYLKALIYNENAMPVLEKTVIGLKSVDFDVSELPQGVYFLKLIGNNSQLNLKFIKM
jgi:uncharacterized protein YjdB